MLVKFVLFIKTFMFCICRRTNPFGETEVDSSSSADGKTPRLFLFLSSDYWVQPETTKHIVYLSNHKQWVIYCVFCVLVLLYRLDVAAGVCCTFSGLYGCPLRPHTGSYLWGYEAGASCSGHTQHLQNHRVPPDGDQQLSPVSLKIHICCTVVMPLVHCSNLVYVSNSQIFCT